ncbi:MAG: hypothetical protein CMK06_08230 [Ponticaulis sp.]|nr:hypothetical protein [Ponticaulis sp.]
MLYDFLFNLAGNADFMANNIQPIFESIDQGPISGAVKKAWYFTPMAGCIHLVALAILGGAVIISDLRIIGPGISAQSPQTLNEKMRPFLIWAAVGLIFSGVLLALGQVMRVYNSPPFWLKMASLFAAIVFTFTTRDAVIRNEGKLTITAWIGLAVSMVVFWLSWINLTDWFFGARQAYLIFVFILAGLVFAPSLLPASVTAPVRRLPQLVSLPVVFAVVVGLITVAFLLSGIDYMTEKDMNGMGIGAFFQPQILGMMLVAFVTGLVAWAGMGMDKQPLAMRIVAAISIFLWASTAISGRWIAFW